LRRKLLAELLVVGRLLIRSQEADPCGRDFVQQALRVGGVFARLKRPQMAHPLAGGVLDDRGVRFQRRDAEQSIVIGRLLIWWNAEPLVIRIELLCHCDLGSPDGLARLLKNKPSPYYIAFPAAFQPRRCQVVF
jgi:hypothetical protein